MKEDLLKIIKHYGVSNQLKKLSEEMFEFQEAVIKYKDDCYYMLEPESLLSDREHILEEIADIHVISTI